MFLITDNPLDLVYTGAHQLEIISAVMHMLNNIHLPKASIIPSETIMATNGK